MKQSASWIILCITAFLNPIAGNEGIASKLIFCEPIIDNIITTDPSDCDINDGSIEILASGGIGTFQFTINGGVSWQSNNIFLDIPAGAYGIGVRNDDETCPYFYPLPIELTGPDSPRFIEVVSTDPTDCGVNDGTITIIAEGGTGPYFYSLDGGVSWGNSSVITGLASGSYTAMVKNADDTCPTSYVFPIQLVAPVAPNIDNVIANNLSDCGSNDGSISVSASGTGNILFSIDNGNSWQTNGNFNGLSPGNYPIQIQNENNTCLVNGESANLLEPTPPLIIDIQTADPKDCKTASGSIIITGASGTGSYQFSINGGISWHTFNIFNDLPAGEYNIQIRNNDSTCPVEGGTIVLTDPPEPEITAVQTTDPTNCGAADGEITIVASGGTGNFEYSLDEGLTWQPGNIFSDLTDGTYAVTIRNDDNTCEVNFSPVLLIDPPQPLITSMESMSPSDCDLNDGSITFFVTQGTGNYEYSIDNGANWLSENSFFNLSEGNYFPMVRNENGTCSVMADPINLEAPLPPVIQSVSGTNPTNCSSANGEIIIEVTEEAGEYEFSIDGGFTWQNSGEFSNLFAETYDIQVRNADGTCPPTEGGMLTLFDPPEPVISTVQFIDPSDCGTNDGSINILATGGFGTLQYSIDNGLNWQTDIFFGNLSQGTFTIKVRNQDGTCAIEGNPIELTDPPAPVIDLIDISDPSDCGASDGLITVTTTVGTGNFEYSLDGGISWQTNNTFSNLSGGQYKIRVKNSDETCPSETETVDLTAPTPPEITAINSLNPTDCGGEDGSINILLSENESAVQFSINGGISWQQSNEFVNLSAGWYVVSLRNEDGTCPIESDPIPLSDPDQPEVISIQNTFPTDCGLTDGTITIISTDGTDLQYSINGGTNWQNDNSFTNLPGGEYVIYIQNGSCPPAYGGFIALIAPVQPEITSIETVDISDCGASDGSIAIITEPGNNYEYSIDGGENWQSAHNFGGLPSGTYLISLRNEDNTCVIDAGTISLTEPPMPTIQEILSSNPTDCDLDNGTILISAEGGLSPLEYSIDNGQNWQTNNYFENLSGGIFSIEVRNATESCLTEAGTIELIPPKPPVINDITSDNPTDCESQNGNIEIFASGGTGEYAFSINGGDTWQTESLFQNLSQGIYEVIIINNNGTCGFVPYFQTIELYDPPVPEIVEVEYTNPDDCGIDNGSITAVVTGGTGNYVFTLILPDGNILEQTDDIFFNLKEGNYSLVVTNDNGTCPIEFESQIILESPVEPEILNVVIEEPSDCGMEDASITIFTVGSSTDFEYSINGGENWQSSSQFLNLTPGNYDLKVRNISGNCEVSWGNLIEITALEAPFITVTSSNISDCGLEDGSIFIEAIGGGNNLLFSINGGESWLENNFFEGLAAGTYSIAVKNINGLCLVQTDDIILKAPLPPEFDLIFGNPTDCNIENGFIKIEVWQGAGNYEYSINGGNTWQAESQFENLGEGFFSVIVRNADETCAINAPGIIELTGPELPVIEGVLYSDPTVCGAEDGIIEIFASAENNLLLYSINNGMTWQASYVFTQLLQGEYEIAVKNLDGTCVINAALVTLKEPDTPIIDEILTIEPTGCEMQDGQIYILAEEENYEFSINGGLSWNENGNFQNLSSGLYELQIRHISGICLLDLGTVQLSAPEQPVIEQIEVENPSGCGYSDGVILIIMADVYQDQEYSIDNGETWQSNGLFNELALGIYPVLVRNQNGNCLVIGDIIELTNPKLPKVEEVEIINPSDCELENGQIIITLLTSENYFQYSIDSGLTWQLNNVFQNLSGGSYSIWINNAEGTCPVVWGTADLMVQEPPFITAIISSGPEDCGLVNGMIEIVVEGSGSYEYSINEGDSWQATPLFTELAAGNYFVQVRNLTGTCTVESNAIELTNLLDDITIGFSKSDPTDCGVSNGKIELIAEGAGSPFEYSIDGGQSWQESPFFNNLPEGMYNTFVRNAGGNCNLEIGMITLSAPLPPTLSQVDLQHPTDCDIDNGMINIIVQGGLGVYQYSIDGGENWQDSGSFINLPQGNYVIAVRNADGTCEILEAYPIQLTGPDLPQIDHLEVSQISDCGLEDGAIYFEGLNLSAWQFSINNGQSWQWSPSFENLEAGTYLPLVRNTNGSCQVEFSAIEIISPQKPVVEALITTPVTACWENDGSLLVIPADPENAYEYSIDGWNTWTNDPYFDQLPPGEVILSYRNANATCSFVARPVIIDGPIPPEIMEVIAKNPENCEGTDGSITILLQNAANAFDYSINGGISWSTDNTFENLSPGTYIVKVRNADGSCEITFQELISLFANANISFELPELIEPLCFGAANGAVTIQGTGGIAPYIYEWSNGESGSALSGLSAGIYQVSIYDSRSCMQSFPIEIKDPDLFEISLGKDIDTTVCLGQNVTYNFEEAEYSYKWGSDSGFESNSPSVSFNESGLYWLTVTNESGCTATDTINVIYREVFFDADFLLPEEGVVNTPIVMIDISWPVPDSISWSYDQNNIFLQQSSEDQEIVLMTSPGIYAIEITAHSGECYGILEKEITIFSTPEEMSTTPPSQGTSGVLEFNLSPNPNNGTFEVNVLLQQQQELELWVIGQDGLQIDYRVLTDSYIFQEYYSFNVLQPGIYTLVLQTDTEWQYINFVVN